MASPAVNLGGHDGQMKALSLQLIVSALEKFSGNKSQAMAYLGLTRPRFYRLLKLHGLYNGAPTPSRNGYGEPHFVALFCLEKVLQSISSRCFAWKRFCKAFRRVVLLGKVFAKYFAAFLCLEAP